MLPLLPLLLVACQDPFAEDRHDLASFRIAAVQARGTDEGLALRALVYGGSGLWHTTPPTVRWTAGGATTTGPQAELAVSPPVEITIEATDGDHTETALLRLDAVPEPPVVNTWTRGVVDLTIEDVVTPIADRDALPVGDDLPVLPGEALRLALDLATPETVTTHWMATGGDFAELDAARTDWFAGSAVVDNGEIESTTLLDAGVQSVVALSFDGQGGASWLVLDAAVATLGPRLLVGGRVFPVDAPSGTGLWAVTPVATEDVAGIALTDVTPVDNASLAEPVCGHAAGAVFDFAALVEGWCGRDEVIGARLVVSGTVRP